MIHLWDTMKHVSVPVTTFVTDLDGTLLVGNDPCPDGVKALEQLVDCGVEVIVATGRAFSECSFMLEACHLWNGSSVREALTPPIDMAAPCTNL